MIRFSAVAKTKRPLGSKRQAISGASAGRSRAICACFGSAGIGLGEEFVDRLKGGIGHRQLLSGNIKMPGRFYAKRGKVGMKKVSGVDLSLGDIGPVLVR